MNKQDWHDGYTPEDIETGETLHKIASFMLKGMLVFGWIVLVYTAVLLIVAHNYGY